jgi:hypothetical protein
MKKKDDTGRLCVEYIQLNATIVKNKYPITIIDDLLDELHSVMFFFSKIDLRADYH